jgi:hypothetical protein
MVGLRVFLVVYRYKLLSYVFIGIIFYYNGGGISAGSAVNSIKTFA